MRLTVCDWCESKLVKESQHKLIISSSYLHDPKDKLDFCDALCKGEWEAEHLTDNSSTIDYGP